MGGSIHAMELAEDTSSSAPIRKLHGLIDPSLPASCHSVLSGSGSDAHFSFQPAGAALSPLCLSFRKATPSGRRVNYEALTVRCFTVLESCILSLNLASPCSLTLALE